jgi:hypothetical protein
MSTGLILPSSDPHCTAADAAAARRGGEARTTVSEPTHRERLGGEWPGRNGLPGPIACWRLGACLARLVRGATDGESIMDEWASWVRERSSKMVEEFLGPTVCKLLFSSLLFSSLLFSRVS